MGEDLVVELQPREDLGGALGDVEVEREAHHFLPGGGPDPSRVEHALMMNSYRAELVRDGSTWRIRRLSIDNLWFTGDPQLLVSQA